MERGSCKGVYCSHVLEHLALEDMRTALKNTYSLLSDEGIFRFVVPDLSYYAQCYLNDSSATAAHTFMKDTGLGQEKRERNPYWFFSPMDWKRLASVDVGLPIH